MTSTDIYERIRQRAYSLWERDGRPHGRQIDHWLQAERELAEPARRPKAAKAATPTKTDRRAPRQK